MNRAAPFAAHVAARMAAGALEYDDHSYGRPLTELLREAMEEAADLGAWGDIALVVLAGRDDLTPAERSTVARAVRAAQSQARWAWERLQRALEAIERKGKGDA